jgi:hypothetical protein
MRGMNDDSFNKQGSLSSRGGGGGAPSASFLPSANGAIREIKPSKPKQKFEKIAKLGIPVQHHLPPQEEFIVSNINI